jgi:hypothetical protein
MLEFPRLKLPCPCCGTNRGPDRLPGASVSPGGAQRPLPEPLGAVIDYDDLEQVPLQAVPIQATETGFQALRSIKIKV